MGRSKDTKTMWLPKDEEEEDRMNSSSKSQQTKLFRSSQNKDTVEAQFITPQLSSNQKKLRTIVVGGVGTARNVEEWCIKES